MIAYIIIQVYSFIDPHFFENIQVCAQEAWQKIKEMKSNNAQHIEIDIDTTYTNIESETKSKI